MTRKAMQKEYNSVAYHKAREATPTKTITRVPIELPPVCYFNIAGDLLTTKLMGGEIFTTHFKTLHVGRRNGLIMT